MSHLARDLPKKAIEKDVFFDHPLHWFFDYEKLYQLNMTEYDNQGGYVAIYRWCYATYSNCINMCCFMLLIIHLWELSRFQSQIIFQEQLL